MGYTSIYSTYDEQLIRQAVYSILYEAICSSTISRLPLYKVNHAPLDNYLDVFDIDTAVEYPKGKFRQAVRRVSEILEQIGVIVIVKNAVMDFMSEDDYDYIDNLNIEKTPKYKTYIVNPSLTCQLIMAVYNLQDIDNYVLGNVYKACVMSYLAFYKESNDKLYFIDFTGKSGKNFELDALMVKGIDERYLYLFECKHKLSAKVQKKNTIVSQSLADFLEERFPNSEIDGKCYVYPGEPQVVEYEGEDFLSKSSRIPPPQHFQYRWGMNAFLCKLLDIFY